MGLFKKLKKLHKKIDPIGSKIHAKTGGKLESKVEGKTPISKMLKGSSNRLSKDNLQRTTPATTPTKVTGGASKPQAQKKSLGSFNNAAISRRRVK